MIGLIKRNIFCCHWKYLTKIGSSTICHRLTVWSNFSRKKSPLPIIKKFINDIFVGKIFIVTKIDRVNG